MDKVQLVPADIPVLLDRIECAKIALENFTDIDPVARRCLEHKIQQFSEHIKYLEDQISSVLSAKLYHNDIR